MVEMQWQPKLGLILVELLVSLLFLILKIWFWFRAKLSYTDNRTEKIGNWYLHYRIVWYQIHQTIIFATIQILQYQHFGFKTYTRILTDTWLKLKLSCMYNSFSQWKKNIAMKVSNHFFFSFKIWNKCNVILIFSRFLSLLYHSWCIRRKKRQPTYEEIVISFSLQQTTCH